MSSSIWPNAERVLQAHRPGLQRSLNIGKAGGAGVAELFARYALGQ